MEPKTKICSKCNLPKSVEDDFGRRTGGGRSNVKRWCKACCAAAVRKTYATSIAYRQSSKASHARCALENHRFIYQYLKVHPCVDCGNPDPLVLQFDHIVLTDKRDCVTGLSQRSRVCIEAEIAKCAVRCANCHAKKTAQERNSIRYQLVQEEMNPEFVVNSTPTPRSRPEREPRSDEQLSEAGRKGAIVRWKSVRQLVKTHCCTCGGEFDMTTKQLKRYRKDEPVFCSKKCSNSGRSDKDRKEKILQAIAQHPEKSYENLGREFGVTGACICIIARKAGISRNKVRTAVASSN